MISQVDAYPMPRVDDVIDKLGPAKYISTLDLTKGYWQVPMAKDDQHKMAFATPFGFYHFRRMPFGLQGPPATFQWMMDCLLTGLQDCVSSYLDDLIIFSNTWDEHLDHLDTVFTRLEEAGLTTKPRKCQFGMGDCVYHGHIVGGERVHVETSKVAAVRQPKTKKDFWA